MNLTFTKEKTNMNTMKLTAVVTGAALQMSAFAASSISVDSVTQRWPWNNKVDITYTVTDGANHVGGVYAGVEFTITVPGRGSFTVPGPTAETGGTGSRQHTFAWSAPSGIKATDCTVTATLFPTNVPGNDYMIIDLATGAVSYERLLVTQEDSNFRYNTPEYKTTKMVLRKIPKWADRGTLPNADDLPSDGYPTGYGEKSTAEWINGRVYRQPDKDYYLGVFDMTVSQFNLITGVADPGTSVAPKISQYQIFRNGTHVNLGGSKDTLQQDSLRLTNNIPASATGSVLARLQYKTGLYFDYPTEVMHEIAARAGATTLYIWGDTTEGYEDYVSCKVGDVDGENLVGTKAANAWGLYDMAGLHYEYCLGASRVNNYTNPSYCPRMDDLGVFQPTWRKSKVNGSIVKGGGLTTMSISDDFFKASCRYAVWGSSGRAACRVAHIVE
jgi:hypothetical protein